MTYALILLVASAALYVTAMPVADNDIANNNDNFQLSHIMHMMLTDPEFQMLNKYEQYKILEAIFNMLTNRQSSDDADFEPLVETQRK